MSVAGVWVNAYGSTLDLRVLNDNLVMGDYRSSTGSTGTYQVIGLQQAAGPTPGAGQVVALAIDWHSVAGGPPDASWHWVSGLSGQRCVEDDADTLVLAHALIASGDFPGLAAKGTYIDKLIYTRSAENSRFESAEPSTAGGPITDPVSGTWRAEDGTELMIRVYPYLDKTFGWVRGNMSNNGRSSVIYGVTDSNAEAAGLQLQSVSITGLPTAAGAAMALAGTLDLAHGMLKLLELYSTPTDRSATYVQTRVGEKTFVRA